MDNNTTNISTRRNVHLRLKIPSPLPIYSPLDGGFPPTPFHYQNVFLHPVNPYYPLGGSPIPFYFPKPLYPSNNPYCRLGGNSLPI